MIHSKLRRANRGTVAYTGNCVMDSFQTIMLPSCVFLVPKPFWPLDPTGEALSDFLIGGGGALPIHLERGPHHPGGPMATKDVKTPRSALRIEISSNHTWSMCAICSQLCTCTGEVKVTLTDRRMDLSYHTSSSCAVC